MYIYMYTIRKNKYISRNMIFDEFHESAKNMSPKSKLYFLQSCIQTQQPYSHTNIILRSVFCSKFFWFVGQKTSVKTKLTGY